MPGIVVDGMDPQAVYEVAGEAIERARKGRGPTLIEAKTMRFLGHYVGDPGTAYGHDKEVGKWLERDPLITFAATLKRKKWLSQKRIDAVYRSVNEEMEGAVEFARNSPEPDLDDAMTDVYAPV